MREIWHVEFAGIFGGASDFEAAVDAGGGLADLVAGCDHDALCQTTRLSDCDCGVARAACVSVRTMPRRASSILKSLWPKPRASRSSASAARWKLSRVGGVPTSNAS